jgi:outer membrane exchange protein TraA
MLLLRHFLVLLPVLLVMSTGLVFAEPLPAVVVHGEPVAPSPGQPGTGLCSASSVSTNPSTDIPWSRAAFNGGINAFLDANASTRVTSVLRTPFDSSNNHRWGMMLSYGDFIDGVPGCPSGGCGFAFNDGFTSFATRLRGFLDVTSGMVGKTLHFGFFADDAVSLTIFDRNGVRYEVINRPPQLGYPTWRTTNSVTFMRPGLYPIEVLYAQFSNDAALEMSILEGAFEDFERPASQMPIINLRDAGFLLVTPSMFHHTESGQPSYPNLDQCAQCDRQYAGTPGNASCGSAHHCNAAALCAPCDSASFCGDSCSPCGIQTPFCVAQAGGGYACAECGQDADCPGGTCQAGTCVPPDAGSPNL